MANMVMTVLEARVPQERWDDLKAAFAQSPAKMPAPMVRMFLVQSATDPAQWRAVAVWQSREALSAYQQSVEAPGGVLFFRSVGAEPTLSLYEVWQAAEGPAAGSAAES